MVHRLLNNQDIEILGSGCSQQCCRFRDKRGIAHLLGPDVKPTAMYSVYSTDCRLTGASFTQALHAAEQGRE